MISLSSLVLSFLLIFIAEIGDKSQLVILSLATKFKVEQEKNNIVLENIEIEDDNGLKIIASEKVPSLIKKEDYIIEVNIKGVKKEDKIIYQRG